jgi:ATP-dependent Clp protease ATP-binding subunit ClpC
MGDASQQPFSTKTRLSLAIARGIAAARGEGDLTSTHVLLGLLREGDNAATRVAQHAGVSLDMITRELEAELGTKGRPLPRQVVVDSTEGEEALVRRAGQEARRRADPFIGTEHILLAILEDQENAASRVLARHGVSVSKGRDYVDMVTGRGPRAVEGQTDP